MAEKKNRHSDVIVGAVLLIFAAIITTQVFQIKSIESRFMPFFALGCISFCAVWMIIRSLLGRSKGRKLGYRLRELVVWGMLAAFWALISTLGFYTSAFLFLFFCQLFLWGRPTGKTLLSSLGYSVGVTAVLYLCFSLLFRIALPHGLLI